MIHKCNFYGVLAIITNAIQNFAECSSWG